MSAMHAEWQTPFEPAEHPEGAIYEDFSAFDRDAMAMRAFHNAAPAEKLQAMERLTDKRFRTFAKRIIFDNFPGLISDADKAAYDQAIIERLNTVEEVPWVTVGNALKDAEALLEKFPRKGEELQRIEAFLAKMIG
jgi:exonuclease I